MHFSVLASLFHPSLIFAGKARRVILEWSPVSFVLKHQTRAGVATVSYTLDYICEVFTIDVKNVMVQAPGAFFSASPLSR